MTAKTVIPGHVYSVTRNGETYTVFCQHPATALSIVAVFLQIFEQEVLE